MKIAIIGGGISGLALANCFNEKNIPYTLYERAAKFGDVGAGIGLSESTYALLKKIGLGIDVECKGYFVEDAIITKKNGKVIRKLPIKNGGFCIHRGELIKILSKNIDTSYVRFGEEVISFDIKNDIIELYLKSGAIEKYDFIFACDGINSIFRKHLFPAIQKRYSGQMIWRGISKLELPEQYTKTYHEFWGENLRFAIIPLASNQYYWYACKLAAAEQDTKGTLKTNLKDLFKSFCKEIGEVIDNANCIINNYMYDLEPHKERWHKNNVIFLGDSIHATTPNLAQGGCQAIEDAYTLAHLLSKKGFCEDSFNEYYKRRFKKVDYIVKQSWNYGRISHQKSKMMEFIVSSVFRLIPKGVFEKQYQKLIDLSYLED